MAERFANIETIVEFVKKYTPCINGETTMECVEQSIRNAPTIEVVPKELYEQILWERNIAMEQLEEHGIGFAAKKKNDVVKAQWLEVSGGRIICDHCGNYPLYDYLGKQVFSNVCPHCNAQMEKFAGDINVGSKKE